MNTKLSVLGLWMILAVVPAFGQSLTLSSTRPINDGYRPVNDGVRPVNDGHRPVNDGYRPVNEG